MGVWRVFGIGISMDEVPWHQGVIRGAERFTRNERKEPRPGDRPRRPRPRHTRDNNRTGGGGQGGDQRTGLVTAAEECKNEMADRIARYAPD